MNLERILEIFLMPGFVLVAVPFAGSVPTARLLSTGLALGVGTLLLVVATYGANSYFGFSTDRLNARLRRGLLKSRSQYLLMSAIALPASLLILARIGSSLPWLALAIFLLWVGYSAPKGAKSRPVLGTLIHFVGQVLQFHLGILAFSQPSLDSFLISLFFAALFSSGHLIHELKDFEPDRSAKIRTNAVVFGPKRVISFYRKVLFLLPLYWAALLSLHKLTLPMFLPFFLASLSHAIMAFRIGKNVYERNEIFQRTYRAFYLVAGLLTFAGTRP